MRSTAPTPKPIEADPPAEKGILNLGSPRFPFVEGCVADAVLAAHLSRLRRRLLPQDHDNLLLAEPATLRRPSPTRVGLYSNLEDFQGLSSLLLRHGVVGGEA